jgi:hypothetical protein
LDIVPPRELSLVFVSHSRGALHHGSLKEQWIYNARENFVCKISGVRRR